MSVEIFGGVNRNSSAPGFHLGFDHKGSMKAQEVRVVTMRYDGERELDIRFKGSREEGDLYELYVRLPVNLATSVARAILNCGESELPEIRLCF